MFIEKIIEKFKDHLARRRAHDGPQAPGGAGAPEFEIFLMSERRSEVEVKDQEVEAFQAAENLGASLRIVDQGRMGFAYTSDLSDSGIQKTVERALETACESSSSSDLGLPRDLLLASNQNGRDYDNSLARLSEKERIDKALELERAALGFHPQIKRVRGASYEGFILEVHLSNSWGLSLHHQRTMNVLSLMAVAEEKEEAEAAFEFEFTSFFRDLHPEKVGREAGRKARRYLGGKPGPTLKGPVLLDCLAAGEIVEVLAPSFFADNLVKKRSLYEGELGRQVLSPEISLVDDGIRPDGFASFPFDGEGVPKRRTVVVEKGVFKEFLIDTEYGRRLGKSSNGGSIREGFRRPPHIGCSNFYIEGGGESFEALHQKIDRGVYITELIGIHTANPISGDFSVGAQGFLIEKGEITTPIKQIALAGNLKEMMKKVVKVGNDLRFYFKVGSPSLLVKEMDIGGT